MSPKKPTGLLGTLTLGGGQTAFTAVEFPTEKEAIEDFILDGTIGALQRDSKPLPWKCAKRPIRNLENDFDFTIPASPPEYLDLMEVAPLQRAGFETAPMIHNQGLFFDDIWIRLTRKAVKYGQSKQRAIHILLYSTDIAFQLSPDLLGLLGHALSVCDRGLATVTYAVPEGKDPLYHHVYLIHPAAGFGRASTIQGRDMIRNITVRVADLSDPVPMPGGTMVTFPFTSLRRPQPR